MSLNNIAKKCLSLVNGCQDQIAIIRNFDVNGISIISLRKENFAETVFTLMLVCGNQGMSFDDFCRLIKYLLPTTSSYVIAGDFNYDLLKIFSSKLLDHMRRYIQTVTEPRHISASPIDYVYVISIQVGSIRIFFPQEYILPTCTHFDLGVLGNFFSLGHILVFGNIRTFLHRKLDKKNCYILQSF